MEFPTLIVMLSPNFISIMLDCNIYVLQGLEQHVQRAFFVETIVISGIIVICCSSRGQTITRLQVPIAERDIVVCCFWGSHLFL